MGSPWENIGSRSGPTSVGPWGDSGRAGAGPWAVGAGTAAGPWSGLVSTERKAVYNPPEPSWINKAFNTTRDGFFGILGGLVETGKAIGSDTLRTTTGALTGGHYAFGDEYKTDDLGKEIAKAYAYTYGPAFKGDFGKTWDRMKEDPFGSTLDAAAAVAAVFSGGASLAARGAGATAKAGSAGRFAKMAGLEESAALSSRLKNASRAGDLEEIAEIRRLASQDALEAGGRNRAVLNENTGQVFTPQKIDLKIDDQSVFQVGAARSPWARQQQKMGAAISNARPGAAWIGAESRAARANKKLDAIASSNEMLRAVTPRAIASAKKVSNSPAQRAALYAMSKGVEPQDIIRADRDQIRRIEGAAKESEAVKQRVKTLEELEDLQKRKGDAHNDYMRGEAQVRVEAFDEQIRVGTASVKKLEADIEELRKMDPDDTRVFTYPISRNYGPVKPGGVDVRMSVGRGVVEKTAKERIASKKKQIATLTRQLEQARRNREIMRELVSDPSKLADMLSDSRSMAKKIDHKEHIVANLQKRITEMELADVEGVFREPTKHMLRVMEGERKMTGAIKGGEVADGYITGVLKDGGVVPREEALYQAAEYFLGRSLEPEEIRAFTGWIRPETIFNTKHAKHAPSKKNKKTGKGDPKLPSNARFNSGYAAETAADSMDPASVLAAVHQAHAFRQSSRLRQRLMDVMQPIPPGQSTRKGWVALDDDVWNAQLRDLGEAIDTDLPMVLGEHNPALLELRGVFKKAVDAAESGVSMQVPERYHKILTSEIKNNLAAIEKLVKAPTAVFRFATLNLRPAWLVNNFVGQLILLTASTGIIRGSREYLSALNDVAQQYRMRKKLGETPENIRSGALDELVPIADERAPAIRMTASTSRSEMGITSEAAERSVLGKIDKAIKGNIENGDSAAKAMAKLIMYEGVLKGTVHFGNFMGRLNAFLTDDIPRRAHFNAQVRGPAMELMKAKHAAGNTGFTYRQAVAMLLDDEEVIAKVARNTLGDLIDYSAMTRLEREAIRPFLPFWSWTRGMTVRTAEMTAKDPVKMAVLYNLGRWYSDDAEERFGIEEVPDFLKGALHFGEDEDGNPRIVTTQGMNPFATPGDVMGQLQNVFVGKGGLKFGGDNPLSQMNPIIKAPLEVAIGKDLFYGGPLWDIRDKPWTLEDESKNNAVGAVTRYGSSLAPVAAIQKSYETGQFTPEEGKNRLYVPSKKGVWSGYAGLPMKTLNTQRAFQIAMEEKRGDDQRLW